MTTVDPLQRAPKPSIQRSRFWPLEFYRSAVGKKYVMAISGIVGLGFIVGHAVGNLHVYEGAARFNEYAEGLRDLGEPLAPRTFLLWVARLGLIASLLVHVHAAYSLAILNRRKRPTGYQAPREYIAADYASRTMLYTGTIVLLFLAFHLADLTWGFFNPDFVRGAVTRNFVASLSRIPVAILYIAGVLALGMHIFHGTWSLFQTMGWNRRRFNRWRRQLAMGLTVVVVAVNLTFPLGALFGVIECGSQCEAVAEEAQQ